MGTGLCITWLKIACGLTSAAGLVAAAASTTSTSGLWLWLFDLLAWPIDDQPGAFQDETFAVNAVLGGVMVGWAALMYFVVSGPFARGDGVLIVPMLVSVMAWFVVDSTGSLIADLAGNVVLNVAFLAIFLPPLLTLRRLLDRPKRTVTL